MHVNLKIHVQLLKKTKKRKGICIYGDEKEKDFI